MEAAFSDKQRPLLTSDTKISDDQSRIEECEKPYKTMVLAQKKPVVETTGSSSGAGTRTPDTRIMILGPEVTKPLENRCFSDSPDSSCSISSSNPAETLAPTASDELLAGLVENADDALLSRLTPPLRFVVQHWPNLSEGDQRAILAIVRRAGSDEAPSCKKYQEPIKSQGK